MRVEEHTTNSRIQTGDVYHRSTQHVTPLRTYANVVASTATDAGQRKQFQPRYTNQRHSQSTVQLEVQWEEKKWLTEAWVGRLKKLTAFESVEEDLPWELGVDVSPKYIGDDTPSWTFRLQSRGNNQR